MPNPIQPTFSSYFYTSKFKKDIKIWSSPDKYLTKNDKRQDTDQYFLTSLHKEIKIETKLGKNERTLIWTDESRISCPFLFHTQFPIKTFRLYFSRP